MPITLTAPEHALVDRRRSGLTQAEAAEAYGLTVSAYRNYENGNESPWDVPAPSLGKLAPHEECFVKRRRTGMTAELLAEIIGVSRYWVHLMETGVPPVKRLLSYWR